MLLQQFTIGLKQHDGRDRRSFLSGNCINVNQVWQARRGLMKSCGREGLARIGKNSMVCQRRMRNALKILPGHVTSRAIIRRRFLTALGERHAATLFRMATQAFAPVIGWRLVWWGMKVRIVPVDAVQLPSSRAISPAKYQDRIMGKKGRF